MDIRPYETSDFDGVSALWDEAFPNDPPWNRAEIAIPEKLAFQADLLFVGVEEGRVIGSVMAGYDGHRGWLYSVAVGQGIRRGGVGTALVRHAEQHVRDLARRQGRQMSQVVNELLADGLLRQRARAVPAFELPGFEMGRPRVDLADRDALESVMEP